MIEISLYDIIFELRVIKILASSDHYCIVLNANLEIYSEVLNYEHKIGRRLTQEEKFALYELHQFTKILT